MFFRGSRYEPVETTSLVRSDGVEIRYKKIRFVRRDPPQMGYVVKEHDRLDTISWQIYQDAEMWWRVADANAAIDPTELTDQPGRVLAIALPVR
jgi:hypothetical protein